jgi:hypothetical protein
MIMSGTEAPGDLIQNFRIFAEKFLDNKWPPKHKDLFMKITVLAWNTSLVKKPERITEIQSFINSHDCPYIQLGSDTYDTLEFTVALAHLKKALFPEVRARIHAVQYQPKENSYQVTLINP